MAIGALLFKSPAILSINSISSKDSAFIMKRSFSKASVISSFVLPTPEKIRFLGSTPAFIAL